MRYLPEPPIDPPEFQGVFCLHCSEEFREEEITEDGLCMPCDADYNETRYEVCGRNDGTLTCVLCFASQPHREGDCVEIECRRRDCEDAWKQ